MQYCRINRDSERRASYHSSPQERYSLETRDQIINEQLRLSKVTRRYNKGSFIEMKSLKPKFLAQSPQSFKVFVEGIQVVNEFDLTFTNFLTGI